MVDYRRMYSLMCTAASEALDALPDTPENAEGRLLLQTALYYTEDIYIAQTEDGEV